MEMEKLDVTVQNLVKAAVKAKDNAYCPYSKFRVGSAVLCANGSIISGSVIPRIFIVQKETGASVWVEYGSNVENASYGLSVCAERVAIWRAVSEGHKSFRACAVSCDIKGEFKGSCGACRQVFAEFNMDLDLYLVKPDMTLKKVILRELLPMAFCPESLEAERI